MLILDQMFLVVFYLAKDAKVWGKIFKELMHAWFTLMNSLWWAMHSISMHVWGKTNPRYNLLLAWLAICVEINLWLLCVVVVCCGGPGSDVVVQILISCCAPPPPGLRCAPCGCCPSPPGLYSALLLLLCSALLLLGVAGLLLALLLAKVRSGLEVLGGWIGWVMMNR